MSGDFYKEWRTNAEVDYYPQLVILWLSTNSWYRSHYSEITGKRDRDFLNKLREDHSTRNKLSPLKSVPRSRLPTCVLFRCYSSGSNFIS